MAEEKVEEQQEEKKEDAVVEGSPVQQEKKEGEEDVKVEEENKEEVEGAEKELEDAESSLKEDDLTPKERDRVQARIDGLISLINRQQKQLEELTTKSTQVKEDKPKYTKEELYGILQDPAKQEYHAWAIDQLTDIKISDSMKGFQQNTQIAEAKRSSYDRACDEFPDIVNPDTSLWKLANRIYIEKGLDKLEDGQYIASSLAAQQLGKGKIDNSRMLERKLDKERAKKSLAGVTKKVVTSDQSALDKLEKAAVGTKSDSPQWRAYMIAREKMLLKKKQ
jgi:hypothetical protein